VLKLKKDDENTCRCKRCGMDACVGVDKGVIRYLHVFVSLRIGLMGVIRDMDIMSCIDR
jgi:hypothetical protein